MNYLPIPQLRGLVKDYHRRMISDDRVSDCENIVFKDGRASRRWGYEVWGGGGGLPLDDEITHLAVYEKAKTQDTWILAFTPRDTYKCKLNMWTQLLDFGGTARFGAVAAAYDGKIYVGTGDNGGYKKDWWAYDISANTWTQLLDFGGDVRAHAVAAAYNGKIYVGTGEDSLDFFKDWWAYDISGNTWTQLLDFGGAARLSAVAAVSDGKIYVGTGNSLVGRAKDWWAYDISANTWSQLRDFGGDARYGAVAAAYDGKIYVGTGKDVAETFKDWWAYDISANTWAQLLDFGTARDNAVTAAYNGKIYLGTGHEITGYKNDWWAYDISANIWSQQLGFDGDERYEAVAAVSDGKIYVGTGNGPTGDFDDWWINADIFKYLTKDFNVGTVTRSADSTTIDLTLQITGNTTSGSAIVTACSDLTDITKGRPISGSGIPANTKILTIDSDTQITLDANATAPGTGTTLTIKGWDTSWPTGVYKIKVGTDDLNGVGSPDEWLDISSWTDEDTLETSESGSAVTDVSYVIRRCWQGDAHNKHETEFPIDPDTIEKIAVMTNGVDNTRKWDGVTETEEFLEDTPTGLPCNDVYPNKCKYLCNFGNHLVGGWVIDSGTNYPQSINSSNIGDPEDYTDGSASLYDLLERGDEIIALKKMQSKMMVYKQSSIVECFLTGLASDPINYDENKQVNLSALNSKVIIEWSNVHIFAGINDIHLFDGMNTIPLGMGVKDTINSNYNKLRYRNFFAALMPEFDLFIYFLTNSGDYNDEAWVYNYIEKSWTYWSLQHNMTAMAIYNKEYVASDRIIKDATPTLILSDKDGYIYEMRENCDDDNGTDIDAFIETKDYPLNDMRLNVSVTELELGMTAESVGSIRVKASTDYGNTWTAWQTISLIADGDHVDHIIHFLQEGRQVRFRIENITGSDFELESLIIGFNDAGVM